MNNEEIEKPINTPEDLDEAAEIAANSRKALENINQLRGVDIPKLEMKCLECNGRKRVDYLRILKAPWYLRILGFSAIKKIDKDVPCKRCHGTGVENLGGATG